MYRRPGLTLYAVYFLYRFSFWDHTWKELFNAVINSLFDTSVSLLAVWFIYRVLEKKYLKNKTPLVFIPAALFSVITACFLLWGLH